MKITMDITPKEMAETIRRLVGGDEIRVVRPPHITIDPRLMPTGEDVGEPKHGASGPTGYIPPKGACC